MTRWVLAVALGLSCAPAQLVTRPVYTPPDPGLKRVVVLEPLFELADLQSRPVMGYVPPYGDPFSRGMPMEVAVVVEKPALVRPEALAQLYAGVLAAVRRLRPSWTVLQPGQVTQEPGTLTLVRTVLGNAEVFASDRAQKGWWFAVGLVVWPALLVAGQPVEETQRIACTVERYRLPAEVLTRRLVSYATQPDSAVNTSGLPRLGRPVWLEVSYLEGLFGDARRRPPVLVEGLAPPLAAAMVALVEEP